MTFAQIITYIVLPVFGAIAAIWTLYARVIVPSWIEGRKDTRVFYQATEGDAFKHTFIINKTLVEGLLEAVKNKEDLERKLDFLTTERIREAEILSDIDIMFHKIETVLMKLNENCLDTNQPDNPVES